MRTRETRLLQPMAAVIMAAVVGATGLATAERYAGEPRVPESEDAPAVNDERSVGPLDPATQAVLRELDQQVAALERTQAMVDESLDARRQALGARARAAYKHLGTSAPALWSAPAVRKERLLDAALIRRMVRRDELELAELVREDRLLERARSRLRAEHERAPSRSWRAPGLISPVAGGRTIASFGLYRHPTSGARLTRRGIQLATQVGAELRAPIAGTLEYRGELANLGPAVVIRHESGYRVILGPARSDVEPGTRLERGQILGQSDAAAIYLEMRAPAGAAGLPVDPAPLMRRDE